MDCLYRTSGGSLRVRSDVSEIALAMTTHTTRHLRRSLMGVAHQSRPPDRVVVSCDNHLPEIESLLRECSAEFKIPITQVRREHQNECRLSQVRNNAVRALKLLGAASDSRVVYLDGDCCPARDAVAAHERAGARAELVIGFRVELTPGQTDGFDEQAVQRGDAPADVTADQWRHLSARHTRYRQQLFLRKIGLSKPHKPKLLGANFSVTLPMLDRINGFDEEFIGYGAEDDDAARRIYLGGGRAAIAVRDAVVFHQWHPTRAAASWDQAPGVARFRMNLPFRCAHGIVNEIAQPSPEVVVFDNGREIERFAIGTNANGACERRVMHPELREA